MIILLKYIFTFLSDKAIITLLRASKPELILMLSLNLSPVTPDLVRRSDPAKSMKLILKDNFDLDILLILSINIMKIAWDLEDDSLDNVDAVFLFCEPDHRELIKLRFYFKASSLSCTRVSVVPEIYTCPVLSSLNVKELLGLMII